MGTCLLTVPAGSESACVNIQLLEYSKTSPSSPPSRSGDPPSILGTESGIIDSLVSKRPEKIYFFVVQKQIDKKIPRKLCEHLDSVVAQRRPEGLKGGPKDLKLEVGLQRGS